MKIKKFIFYLVIVIGTVAIDYGLLYLSNIHNDHIFSREVFLVQLIGFFLGIIVFILIHEFGHYVFGRLTGFSLVVFRILFMAFYRNKNGKVRVKFSPSPFGGQCLMAPPRREESKKHPFYLYNAGGLIFSYTSTIGLLGCLLITDNYFISEVLIGMLIISIYLLVINSIVTKNAFNDVVNMNLVRKNNELIQTIYFQMCVSENLVRGLPYSAETEYHNTIENEINHLVLPALLFSYFAAVETNDYEKREYFYEIFSKRIGEIKFIHHRIIVITLAMHHAFVVLKDISKVMRFYGMLNDNEKKLVSRPKNAYYHYYILAEELIEKKQATWDLKRLVVIEKVALEGEVLVYNKLRDELDIAIKEFISNDYQMIKQEGEDIYESISIEQEPSTNA